MIGQGRPQEDDLCRGDGMRKVPTLTCHPGVGAQEACSNLDRLADAYVWVPFLGTHSGPMGAGRRLGGLQPDV